MASAIGCSAESTVRSSRVTALTASWGASRGRAMATITSSPSTGTELSTMPMATSSPEALTAGRRR